MNYLGTDATAGPLPTRTLGTTGAEIPIVGFGAIAILSPSIVDSPDPQAAANDCVKQAVEAGFTYFDIGPAYGGGRAEALPGPALAPFRERCFIAAGACLLICQSYELQMKEERERGEGGGGGGCSVGSVLV